LELKAVRSKLSKALQLNFSHPEGLFFVHIFEIAVIYVGKLGRNSTHYLVSDNLTFSSFAKGGVPRPKCRGEVVRLKSTTPASDVNIWCHPPLEKEEKNSNDLLLQKRPPFGQPFNLVQY
jgi:hypothetical protein